MKRKYYVSWVHTYRNRRAELKKKYSGKEYAKKALPLSRKIATWQRAIRRIDERNSLIHELLKSINEFFSVDIKTSKTNHQHRLARHIYYKYGMEQMKIYGTFLSEYIGRKGRWTASRCRQRLTRRFKNNPDQKKAYHDFNDYMKKYF